MDKATQTPDDSLKMTDENYLIQAREICKSFASLQANDRVSLNIRCGSIHALIGENGAGKSTLVSVLCGLLRADSGTLHWRGHPVTIPNPAAAYKLGIGVVFQHFALVEQLSVAENIALSIGVPIKKIAPQLREITDRYGLAMEPNRRVGELSAGEKQRVEILRCLLQNPQLLILDEPTSVLTPGEAEELFTLLRRLAEEGRGVLFISHKLDEVCALCDSASVLRQGRMVAADINPEEVGRNKLIRLMLGDEEVDAVDYSSADGDSHPVILAAHNLSLPSAKPLSVQKLSLRGGVITGIAGIAGNGQNDLLDCLSGETTVAAKMILLDDKPIGDWNARRRVGSGILSAPTERHGRAAVSELSLSENALLGIAQTRECVRRGFVQKQVMHDFAAKIMRVFSVRANSPNTLAAELSGGNLQKFIVGRALLQNPRVLLVANPTWGVDVKSAAFIRNAIGALRQSGAAVLVLSEDLDELLSLCDEIAVINGGSVTQPIPREQVSIDEIGARMTAAKHGA